jgi:hypothetical protein
MLMVTIMVYWYKFSIKVINEVADRYTFISNMYNGSEVITEPLSYSKQQHWSFQKLQDAPEQAEWKMMYCSGAVRGHSGAPQSICSSRPEYKNILMSMKLSAQCYKIMPVSW